MNPFEIMKEHYINMYIIKTMMGNVGRYIPINELVKYPLEQQYKIVQLFETIDSYPIETQDAIIAQIIPQLEIIKETKQK